MSRASRLSKLAALYKYGLEDKTCMEYHVLMKEKKCYIVDSWKYNSHAKYTQPMEANDRRPLSLLSFEMARDYLFPKVKFAMRE